MAVRCRRCGRQYDITLFSFERTIRCDCGAEVSASTGHTLGWPESDDEGARHRRTELARHADRVSAMIVAQNCPDVDVYLEVGSLRARCQALQPDGRELYEQLYASRFRRLWAQFRRWPPPFPF